MDINGNRTLEPVRKQLEEDGRKTEDSKKTDQELEQDINSKGSTVKELIP
jgi:hypothetical protein